MARKSLRDLPGEALDKPVGAARQAASKATGSATKATGSVSKAAESATELAPTSHLQQSLQSLAGTMAERALGSVTDKLSGTAERLTQYAEGGAGGGNLLAALTGVEKLAGGSSPMQAAMSAGMSKVGHSVKEKFNDAKEALTGGKGKGGGGKQLKLTNIVEHIDVGVPVELAYDQWTQFADFPKFMKKLEQVEQVSDEKLTWTGKVFWSRRSWESTIIEQVPYERIIWRSKGHKGYIDGAVTFHELTPDLTRIILVLEYHPNGVFEKTANIWRAAGRRARLELKHFQRHVMTETVLHQEDVEGWHGEIRDKKVVSENAVDEEASEEETPEDEAPEEEAPEDETTEDETSEKEAPDSETSEDETPDDEEPRKATGKKTARTRGARTRATDDDRTTGPDKGSQRSAPPRKTGARRRASAERRGADKAGGRS